MLPACRLHCISGNSQRKFLIHFPFFPPSLLISPYTSLYIGIALNSFSERPRDYVRFNSPVDNMYDSGDPDGKSSTRMLVVIFRLNVKS